MQRIRRKNTRGLSSYLTLFVLLCFLFALSYVGFSSLTSGEYRAKNEYKIILFQLSAGCLFLLLPRPVSKALGAEPPPFILCGYVLFLWCSIFLGEFCIFYYRFAFWDAWLHIFSAALLSLAVLSFTQTKALRVGAILSAILAATVSISIGVAWEIYEFCFDGLLGLNMQKFATPSTEGQALLSPLVGRAALFDTMSDLVFDAVAAVSTAAWGYIRLKRAGELPKYLRAHRAKTMDS